jgi:hypothetical protein
MIANLDGQHIDVAHCPVAEDDFMVPDIDVVLAMTPNGWQTTQVLHTDAAWETFAHFTEKLTRFIVRPPSHAWPSQPPLTLRCNNRSAN